MSFHIRFRNKEEQLEYERKCEEGRRLRWEEELLQRKQELLLREKELVEQRERQKFETCYYTPYCRGGARDLAALIGWGVIFLFLYFFL
jgi:hypothetical protein